eukprot:184277_1
MALIIGHVVSYIAYLFSRSIGHYRNRPGGNSKLYGRNVNMKVISQIFDFGLKVSKYPLLFYLRMVSTAYQRNLNAINMENLIQKSIDLNSNNISNNIEIAHHHPWTQQSLNIFKRIEKPLQEYLRYDLDTESVSDSTQS